VKAQLRKLGVRRVIGSVRQDADRRNRTDLALDQLRDQGTETLFVFGQVEPLFDRLERDGQLARLERWPNISVERISVGNELIPAGDHTFRTIRLQQELHQCLDGALERVLTRAGPPGVPR
jgi:hypothetical protein